MRRASCLRRPPRKSPAWLRENIHRHGGKFKPAELVKRVTGEAMQAEPFLSYLPKKYGEIYALDV
jgi:carboxypeptidase Taq